MVRVTHLDGTLIGDVQRYHCETVAMLLCQLLQPLCRIRVAAGRHDTARITQYSRAKHELCFSVGSCAEAELPFT